MQTSPFIAKDTGFCFSQSQKKMFHFYPAGEHETKYSTCWKLTCEMSLVFLGVKS